jgi:hypothetical protein
MEHNLLINNDNVLEGDIELFFAEPEPENFQIIPAHFDMWDLLAHLKLFPSKSQARKDQNWKHVLEIPKGFNEFTIGKLKHKIFIFNPS